MCWDLREAEACQTSVAFKDLCCCVCGAVVATLRTAAGKRQGQREGYLLWEFRVVESGLKDAGRKDWKRRKAPT